MDHLPECLLNDPEHDCICDFLRACEQRVLTDVDAESLRQNMAFQRGVQAARDAVAPLAVESRGIAMKDDVLAAIDALREDRSGNPDTPPSAEKGEQA